MTSFFASSAMPFLCHAFDQVHGALSPRCFDVAGAGAHCARSSRLWYPSTSQVNPGSTRTVVVLSSMGSDISQAQRLAGNILT